VAATKGLKKMKRRNLYVVDYLLTPEKRIEHAAVLCENERIIAIGGESSFSLEPGVTKYTYENAYLTPGFIDTHIHGAGGFDSSSAADSPRSLDDMSVLLGQRGVTSFVPTVVADRPEKCWKICGHSLMPWSSVCMVLRRWGSILKVRF
jgi:N-acetylglucosamine-6-phosphate deacetylase